MKSEDILIGNEMELDRDDVLELLSIASGPDRDSLSALLTFFCDRNPVVRFASLWRLNKCNNTISIFARSNCDNDDCYAPQLKPDGTGIQEFICSTDCASVSMIVESDEFRKSNRINVSLTERDVFDEFHPSTIVGDQGLQLDQFVVIPVNVAHQPDEELPRCLTSAPMGPNRVIC